MNTLFENEKIRKSVHSCEMTEYSSPESLQLLQKEGPKYQYGNGCLSDGVIGVWLGELSGLKDIVDAKKIESHLVALHNNLKDRERIINKTG